MMVGMPMPGVVMIMTVIMIVRVIVAVPVAVFMHRFDARRDGHLTARLRVEFAAEQQHQRRSAQRKERDQPDMVQEKVHAVTTSISPLDRPARSLYCGTMRSEYPAPRLLPPPHR